MKTYHEFLYDTVQKGESINTLFEERLYALIGTLERVAIPLAAEKVEYELIGGAAVMLQVNQVEPSAVRNTKDIDIMIRRQDLERVKTVTERAGFTFRHAAGLDMLLPHGQTQARNAVHLIFAEEKVRPNQAEPNPPLRPEYLSWHGIQVAIITVADLVRMKLSSNRDIDRVHIRDLHSVGLLTPQIEHSLPQVLSTLLQDILSRE